MAQTEIEAREEKERDQRGKKKTLRGLENGGIDKKIRGKGVAAVAVSELKSSPHFSPPSILLPVLHAFASGCFAFCAL